MGILKYLGNKTAIRTSRIGTIAFFLILIFLSAPSFSQTIFKIGKPDAYSSEFRLFRNLSDDRYKYEKGYDQPHRPFRDIDKCQEFFSKPIIYRVGFSKDRDWPFVHPFTFCDWAGVSGNDKAPTFKIEFSSPPKSNKDFYLKIGLTDSAPTTGIGLRIKLNGQDIGSFRAFYKSAFGDGKPENIPSCGASLVYFPLSWGVPSSKPALKISSNLFKSDGSKNVLEIIPSYDPKTRMKLWMTYDYLELSDKPDLPKVPDYREILVDEAIKAMNTEEVVFCTRGEGRDWHWYANYGKSVCANTGRPEIDQYFDSELFTRMGGKLGIYNLKTGKHRYLINDKKGCVRDAQVSYDGKKILFSYRKGDSDLFHIYEIDIDGKNLTKLPFAGNWNDIEPCYLPNGDILYTSDRLNKTVQCFYVPVSNLHRWFKAENAIRCITVNPDVDNRPEIMPDGRIIYMRWDYNHRTQLGYHNLWTISPDGSGDMIFYGNEKPGGLFIGAKPIPDQDGIVTTYAPGHGIRDHRGYIGRALSPFDPSDTYALEIVNGDYPPRFFDPYPIKNSMILTSDGNRIILMSSSGQMYTDFKLPEDILLSDNKCYMNIKLRGTDKQPECKVILRNIQPLAPRPVPPMRPDLADFDQKTAVVFMQDVYHGRKMQSVKRGTIKKLLITQMMPEPVHYHGGYQPINLQGGFALEKVLGTIPVAEDGSASFEVPSQKALAFIALDENNRAVKRMQSFVGFAPGTSTSCIGCHERRTEAPIRKIGNPLSYGKVSKIIPIKGVPPMIDYLRHVQPIFDKYCVECHNPQNPTAGVVMTGDLAPTTIHSRFILMAHSQLVTGFNKWGNMEPYTFGSGGSKLMEKADGKHHNKKFEETDMNILRCWLDTGSAQIGTYAAAGTGFLHMSYYETGFDWERDVKTEVDKINQVVGVVCGKCHDKNQLPYAFWWNSWQRLKVPNGEGKTKDTNLVREILYSLSRPEHSIALLTPLPKSLGGRAEGEYIKVTDKSNAGKIKEILSKPQKAHPVIFKDKNDYEYKKMLSGIKAAADYLKKKSPFQNSPDFRPSYGYLKMMQKCGILPADHDFSKPLDAMQIDEKYFQWQEDNILLFLKCRNSPFGDCSVID